MRFHRPARRIALGLGAAGIALGASGATAAATALIQPAGALSVQVPAVAVREQNVNAAGRIRVALPNGTVNVGNLPVNSAGRVQVSTGPATAASVPHEAMQSPLIPNGATVTVVSLSGPGVFTGLEESNVNGAAGCLNATITIDGNAVFNDGSSGLNGGAPGGFLQSPYWGGQAGNFYFYPPNGMNFARSFLYTQTNHCGYAIQPLEREFYTTPS
jgi:hypothetical protein